MKKVIIIAAVDDKFGISKDEKLPWRNSKDMTHFKNTTKNKCVIMGKNTFLSIGKVLPNRINVVMTSDPFFNIRNAQMGPFIVASSIEDALSHYEGDNYVIGGSKIYNLFKDKCDEMIITHIKGDYHCDKFFPVELFNRFKTQEKIYEDDCISIVRYK